MSLKDRLKFARRQAGLTQTDLAKDIDGLTQSAYSQLESGKSKKSMHLVQIAEKLGVCPTWLATGKGSPAMATTLPTLALPELKDRLKFARKKANLSQNELAKKIPMNPNTYRNLESGHTNRTSFVPDLARALHVNSLWLATGQGEAGFTSPATGRAKPVYVAPVLACEQAGDYYPGNPSYQEFLPHNHASDYSFWLRISDDSMTPDFLPGDLVLIDTQTQGKTGAFVLAIAKQESMAVFRRYKTTFASDGVAIEQLIALNNFYSTIDSRYQSFALLGAAVAWYRWLK